MIFRQSLLLGVATAALAGVGHAQTRGQSRDDLLDALTRHIQICGEITDTQQRLSCYDRLQTQVGGVSAPAPTPTPLQAAPAPSMQSTRHPARDRRSAARRFRPSRSRPRRPPLAPQPLGVPGGGVATLGGPSPPLGAPPSSQDPNAAFDPSSSTYRRAGGGRPQAAAADAPHRSPADSLFVDATAAGDPGRHQPHLWRFALLAGHGHAHLQHAARPSAPRRNAPS